VQAKPLGDLARRDPLGRIPDRVEHALGPGTCVLIPLHE